MFLDPQKPLHTCQAKSCNGCTVSNDISCHFTIKQLLHFLWLALTPFIIGSVGLYAYNWKFFALWMGIAISFFYFIEIRVMCSHCPHYAEPTLKTLKCWANYGAPKLWKYNPGPMSKIEKIVFSMGAGIVFLYPVPFLFFTKEWFLLLIYVLTVTGFLSTLRTFLCTQCMNFACPANAVPEEARNNFFRKNPKVAKAWEKIVD